MRNSLESTVLVTGATDGLGRSVTLELASRGAKVLLQGRSRERCEAVLEEVRTETGDEGSRCYLADLSSLDAVRGLAGSVRGRGLCRDRVVAHHAAIRVPPLLIRTSKPRPKALSAPSTDRVGSPSSRSWAIKLASPPAPVIFRSSFGCVQTDRSIKYYRPVG